MTTADNSISSPTRTQPGGKRSLLWPRLSRLGSRLWLWARQAGRALAPGARAWRGATYGMLVFAVLMLVWMIATLLTPTQLWYPASLLVAALLAAGLAAALLSTALWLFMRLPRGFRWALLGAVPLLALVAGRTDEAGTPFFLAGMAAAIAGGGAVAALAATGWAQLTRLHRTLALGGLALSLALFGVMGWWLLEPGHPAPARVDASAVTARPVPALALPDPSQPGAYAVKSLTYGSGTDRNRPEFGAGAALTTEPVDASALVGGWGGLMGWFRDRYWGFGLDALPRNGTVWYPEGEGPFPLVLAVHGNHLAEDFSDPGYAYLGELLASKGYIFVSVDENFLNGSIVDLPDNLQQENDARGWLLLEHLRQWHAWNATPGNPFYGKVDTGNIGLIGHSRGGEAVAIAAAFNRLPYYPDNATLAFDYGYGIRTVVAIAPIDGQYHPAQVDTPVRDVNYLVLQGAHDADLNSFSGWAQYDRVAFSGGDWFKATVYVDRANHGQFNTTWGDADYGMLSQYFLNRAALLPAEAQRQIARSYIGAFLDATLRGETGYRPFFRDHRRGAAWLPDAVYITHYQDAGYRPIAGFREDIDLATGTVPGSRIVAANLPSWREQVLGLKWASVPTRGAYLGWSHAQAGGASYAVTMPAGAISTTAQSMLVLDLADAAEDPLRFAEVKTDHPAPVDGGAGDEQAGEEVAPATTPDGPLPIDLTVEVVDAGGDRARLPLSHFAALQPQLKAEIWKSLPWQDRTEGEPVLQRFEYPLADFAAANPAFDPVTLRTVRLVFDRTAAGVVIVAGIGLSQD